MERQIAGKLFHHLSSNNILNEGQSIIVRLIHWNCTSFTLQWNVDDRWRWIVMDLIWYFLTLVLRLMQSIVRFFLSDSRIFAVWLKPQPIGFAPISLVALRLSASKVNCSGAQPSSQASPKELFWALLATSSTPTHYLQLFEVITFVLILT
jgi:hypothetical protein